MARSKMSRALGFSSTDTSATATMSKVPLNGSILATLPGSFRVRDASMSPAAMMLPADISWLMMPDSVA